jgi:hypothetical protein
LGSGRASVAVQVRLRTELTVERYITGQQWRNAIFLPHELQTKNGWRRHGNYLRRKPAGLRIPRWYNRDKRITVSLIPDFAATRVSSSLGEIEDVVDEAERLRADMSLEHVAARLRPDLVLPSAVRWLRRRRRWVGVALRTLKGLAADKLSDCALSVAAFRLRLNVDCVLVRAREIAAKNLRRFPAPVGFAALPKPDQRPNRRAQHKAGADPPAL